MAQNVSEQLADLLAKAGARHVFGVTGDAINYFVEAVQTREDMQWVGVRHEGNGAFAAYAQGALSGTIGVCAGTLGPGALHLVNGLYSAKRERTPLIAVTGQIEREQLGTNFFQETDLKNIFDAVCGYQAIIRTPEEAPRAIMRAIQTALAERTVCRIELPADVGQMEATGQRYLHPVIYSDATLVPGKSSITAAAKWINRSERITFLAGAGCRHAKTKVLELAQKLNAPIVFTYRSADIFDLDTPQVVGQTGLIGNPSGYKAIMNCDLLLMLGTDFPYDDFLPHDTATVQVDLRLENIGNRTSVVAGVHGDMAATIDLLLPEVQAKTNSDFLKNYADGFQQWRQDQREKASPERDMEPLHPQIFTRMVDDHAADDAIFTIETSTAAIWAARTISFHSGRRILGSFNHGSMAVGLPAAIGAQLLHPEREVWCLSGDGGFNMVMQDFMTAVEWELPLKVIIFNNSELSLIKLEMEQAGKSPNLGASKFKNPNFADFAHLCGGEGVRVEKAQDIEPAIRQAKNSDKPFIIDAIVSSGELPFPPNVSLEQAIKLGMSKLEEVVEGIKGDKAQLKNMVEEWKALRD